MQAWNALHSTGSKREKGKKAQNIKRVKWCKHQQLTEILAKKTGCVLALWRCAVQLQQFKAMEDLKKKKNINKQLDKLTNNILHIFLHRSPNTGFTFNFGSIWGSVTLWGISCRPTQDYSTHIRPPSLNVQIYIFTSGHMGHHSWIPAVFNSLVLVLLLTHYLLIIRLRPTYIDIWIMELATNP